MDAGAERDARPFSAAELGPRLESLRPRLKRMLSLRLDPRLRRRIDSSDVLQEAFTAATQRFEEYRGSPAVPFYVWVRQLTLQKLIDLHRRHMGTKGRDVRREVAGDDSPEGTTASLVRVLIDEALTPHQSLVRKEQEQRLREALGGLKEIDQEILMLRYFERLTNEECASVIGLTPTAAKLRHLRAAKRLREILRTRMGLPEDLLGA